MAYRIAVASTDGIVVNQHFGHAERFHIIEIDDNTYRFIGTREVERVCQGHYHNDSSFDKVIDVLSDVHAVVVAKIGSAELLFSIGMHCLGCPSSGVETISDAATVHGLDAENLVAQLNTIIKSDSI